MLLFDVSPENGGVQRNTQSVMPSQKSILIVEDDAEDMARAVSVVRSLGVESVHPYGTAAQAQFFLEKCLAGEHSVPDAIILDLDLGQESGYELLRFWRTSPGLAGMAVVVWSGLGDHYRDLCDLFRVNVFIPKWKGADALKDALSLI